MWVLKGSASYLFGISKGGSSRSMKGLKAASRDKYECISEDDRGRRDSGNQHDFLPPSEESGIHLPERESPPRGRPPQGLTSLALDRNETHSSQEVVAIRSHGNQVEGSERVPLSPCRSSRVNGSRMVRSPVRGKHHGINENSGTRSLPVM
ncbi:hypothetical protein GUITHDRAFT_154293 [Guillardia theta CCMP2712]|uniref:Uncharacterized protein n=2 Tax=Guillardia theta TaxID=55529 RepID=L1IU81_GUITC|nr:hypothetical protein GUITHDRAFT_154293 [Guillardia theta CCMP2712]EKX39796.1 hypothetical protein GUITHDRAFT_154293 [Guillardia theta CCMP2712]|mmetsp:Transcript_35315/g.110361  ORF Transcript_35315/g.110361 Transcript_35315/m.110361 type:complete len:151 (+) Transcript_35315:175-627(+)|eukprot:XP_005826776.1 hypothetical protein GUITHDRAFT_154293 [Guillardia theta CCMP2712]